MRLSNITHALALCLLCAGCLPIPPREGPEPRNDPWQAHFLANGDVQSGFDTFTWSTRQLRDGHTRVVYGGGYFGFSGRTPDLSLRKSASYTFGLGDDRAPADRRTYEVREINRCIESTSIELVWAAISSEGRVASEDQNDTTYGRLKRYDRVSQVSQGNANQVEAGFILDYRNRIYLLRVFELRGSLGEAENFEQALTALREKSARLLRSIDFKRGDLDMCHFIATKNL